MQTFENRNARQQLKSEVLIAGVVYALSREISGEHAV